MSQPRESDKADMRICTNDERLLACKHLSHERSVANRFRKALLDLGAKVHVAGSAADCARTRRDDSLHVAIRCLPPLRRPRPLASISKLLRLALASA